MGLLNALTSLFKGLDFGRIDPNDLQIGWRVELELDQAEREGDAQLAAALDKYGLSSMGHWEKVKNALDERHMANPEYQAALTRVRAEHQQQMMNAAMKGPPK